MKCQKCQFENPDNAKFCIECASPMSGADLKDIKEIIGHSDLSMTDRYSHLTMKHKFSRQQKLAEHYYKGLEYEDAQVG